MGYALMWIADLAANVLLVVWVTAAAARIQRRWLRRGLPLAAAVLVLVAAGAFTIGTYVLHYIYLVGPNWFVYTLAWTLAYGVAAGAVLAFGWRPREGGATAAARWPAGRLAVAFGAALALDLMTLWNLDTAAQTQLASLRAEAGALALSVAPARVPDRENAALVYQQAFDEKERLKARWAEKEHEWFSSEDGQEAELNLKDPELPKYLDEHARALALLRQAAAMPDCYFEREWGRPSVDMLLPEFGPLRGAARLLALDARAKAAAGDAPAAVQDLSAIWGMAAHTRTEPLLIGALVAMAIDAQAADALEKVLATGHVKAADLAALRLDENVSYQRVMARAFRMEEAFGLSCFTMFADGSSLYLLWAVNAQTPPVFGPAVSLWRVFMMPTDVASYRRVLHDYQQACQQPYYEDPEKRKHMDDWLGSGECGVMTRMLAPSLSGCVKAAAKADARHRLVRAAVAAVAWRAKRGQWPARLEDLVPDDLRAVPVDPFDGKPLRMVADPKGLVLYSIGDDGKDDGGAEWNREEQTGDIVFRLPAN